MVVKRDKVISPIRDKENEYIVIEDPPGGDFEQDILMFLEGEEMASKFSARVDRYDKYRNKPFIKADKILDIIKDTLKSSLLTLIELRESYMSSLKVLDEVVKMLDCGVLNEEIIRFIMDYLEKQSKREESENDGIQNNTVL